MMNYKLQKPIHGTIGVVKYECTIEWRNGKFISDEPVSSGGKDLGPDPHTLLLSGVASCTLITLRMYIDHKGWDIPEIAVNANMYQETIDNETISVVDRDILFYTPVDPERKMKLVEIAKKCPISRILEHQIKVRTFLFHDEATEKKINYANKDITVVWKPEFCQHSQRCWRQLPGVFDYKKKHWINPDGASPEEIIAQVNKCPSGALSFFVNKEQNSGTSSV